MSNYVEQISEVIIKGLEAGPKKWRQAWRDSIGQHPLNGVSNRRYRGANWLKLLALMKKRGWSDPRFFTQKQIEKLGGSINYGEAPQTVRYCNQSGFFGMLFNGYRNNGGNFVVHYSEVYNAQQCTGLPELTTYYEMEWTPHEMAERVIQSSGVEIVYDQADRQCYNWEEDKIHMTPKGNFENANNFYETVFHELAHATGHETRMKRELKNGFGSVGYAKEELIAEISSMMMCAKLGIETGEMSKHHISYIDDWIQLLKDKPSEVVKACNAAERICDWLFSRVENKEGMNLYQELLIAKPISKKKKTKMHIIDEVIFSGHTRPLEEIVAERQQVYKPEGKLTMEERLLRMEMTGEEIKERIRKLAEGTAEPGIDHRNKNTEQCH